MSMRWRAFAKSLKRRVITELSTISGHRPGTERLSTGEGPHDLLMHWNLTVGMLGYPQWGVSSPPGDCVFTEAKQNKEQTWAFSHVMSLVEICKVHAEFTLTWGLYRGPSIHLFKCILEWLASILPFLNMVNLSLAFYMNGVANHLTRTQRSDA